MKLAIDLRKFTLGEKQKRTEVARAADSLLRENGFFLLERHGVDEGLIRELTHVSREFFAQPFETKMRVAQPAPGIMRGYVAVASESLSYSLDQKAPPDLNESFMIGPLRPGADPYYFREEAAHQFAPNLWPQHPRRFEDIWRSYYDAMSELSDRLLQLFACALELEEAFFTEKADRPISRLRARYYPNQPSPPQPDQLRAGAHTDYGTMAIVLTENRPGGLQFLTQEGLWVDVPLVPGALVVNAGDLLARWTGDRWPAAVHRVANPSREAAHDSDRLSHIFFHAPNYDTEIECLGVCGNPRHAIECHTKFQKTTAVEHLKKKFLKAQQLQD